MPIVTGVIEVPVDDGFFGGFGSPSAGVTTSHVSMGFLEDEKSVFTYDSFFNFSGINIPRNSTINSAVINFAGNFSGTVNEGTVDVVIYGGDVDNAASPGNGIEWGEIPKTSSSVRFFKNVAGLPTFTTPNLSGVVQEVVNRDGWSPGNKMIFLFDASLGVGDLAVVEAKSEDKLHPAYIVIDYTEPEPVLEPVSTTTTKSRPNNNIQQGSVTCYVNKFGNSHKKETPYSGHNFIYLNERFDETQYYGS